MSGLLNGMKGCLKVCFESQDRRLEGDLGVCAVLDPDSPGSGRPGGGTSTALGGTCGRFDTFDWARGPDNRELVLEDDGVRASSGRPFSGGGGDARLDGGDFLGGGVSLSKLRWEFPRSRMLG